MLSITSRALAAQQLEEADLELRRYYTDISRRWLRAGDDDLYRWRQDLARLGDRLCQLASETEDVAVFNACEENLETVDALRDSINSALQQGICFG